MTPYVMAQEARCRIRRRRAAAMARSEVNETAPDGSAARHVLPAVLLVGLALLAAVTLAHRPWPSLAATQQNLTVIDGDTLQSGSDIVQLYGIDAPELGQLCHRKGKPWQCGVEAAFALHKLVALSGTAVICEDWHDATAAAGPTGEGIRVCQLGKDQELGLSMLRNGYAMAVPGSFPFYGQIERQAKAAGLGLWGSEFMAPWEWREGRRIAREVGQLGEDCNVKGILDDGSKIYLVPTDRNFARATVDQSQGEQLFCSDEEARRAGWRRPGETERAAVR
jgi:endonuclease YncB( thermonuclease family)